MDVVLQLRGCNKATVRDMVDLRKYVHNQLTDVVGSVTEIVNSLGENIRKDCQLDRTQSMTATTTLPQEPDVVVEGDSVVMGTDYQRDAEAVLGHGDLQTQSL